MRFLVSLLLLFALLSLDAVAQNTPAPDAVIHLVNEAELGVQVDAGVQYRNQTAVPIERETLEYLTRPVRGQMTYVLPYYGAGVTIRFRRAELAFAYHVSDGVEREHWLRFQDGARAIPFTPSTRRWVLRTQYFVLDWIGAGVQVGRERVRLEQQYPSNINGQLVSSALFSANAGRKVISAYVPVRRTMGRFTIFGRLGTSILSSGTETYFTDFVRKQSPENPGRPTVQDSDARLQFGSNDPSITAQFGRAGIEFPAWQTTIRTTVQVERLSVSDLTKTWTYDLKFEVGLPF